MKITIGQKTLKSSCDIAIDNKPNAIPIEKEIDYYFTANSNILNVEYQEIDGCEVIKNITIKENSKFIKFNEKQLCLTIDSKHNDLLDVFENDLIINDSFASLSFWQLLCEMGDIVVIQYDKSKKVGNLFVCKVVGNLNIIATILKNEKIRFQQISKYPTVNVLEWHCFNDNINLEYLLHNYNTLRLKDDYDKNISHRMLGMIEYQDKVYGYIDSIGKSITYKGIANFMFN